MFWVFGLEWITQSYSRHAGRVLELLLILEQVSVHKSYHPIYFLTDSHIYHQAQLTMSRVLLNG